MATFSNKKVGKVGDIFLCEFCEYICERVDNFDKHLLTPKHQSATFSNKKVGKVGKVGTDTNSPTYNCKFCNETYKSRSGLWRHKKICKIIIEQNKNELNDSLTPFLNDNDNGALTKLFLDSIKENQELQKQMFELFKDNIGSNNTVNSNNNTMNNQFNLQFFLNETCKDAMNINDFIDYVKVKLEDFENFGAVGYPKALGEIIVRNLNELDVKMRPIHCSDLKREVLHVKHDGVWHSDESREFMKRSIMYIAHKNIKQIPTWQDKNPESKNCNTKTFDRYNKMFRASLGPANEEEKDDYLKKITGMIAKEVVIDKKKKY